MTYDACLSLRGPALQEALHRDVWTITRAGLHMTRHTPHARATAFDIAERVATIRQHHPAAVCLNLLPLHVAEWLLETLND
jgi:hypothetical protein